MGLVEFITLSLTTLTHKKLKAKAKAINNAYTQQSGGAGRCSYIYKPFRIHCQPSLTLSLNLHRTEEF